MAAPPQVPRGRLALAVPRDGEGRLVALSVSGLLAALAALALVRGPLIYDGSFFLYQVLQTGAPFIPDNRVVAVPVHLLVIALARATDDTWTISLVFSALYIALAAGAYLGSAWWLRRQAPRLLAWPLLGLLAVSPILIDSTTESLVTGADNPGPSAPHRVRLRRGVPAARGAAHLLREQPLRGPIPQPIGMVPTPGPVKTAPAVVRVIPPIAS